MKKNLYSILFLLFFSSFSLLIAEELDIENNKTNVNKCDKCVVDDDEYCIYNECYFDRKYRNMKKSLCLTRRQEMCIDNYYRNFKSDMENIYSKYIEEKNELLEMIECDKNSSRQQKREVKIAKSELRERYRDFREEVKDILSRKQISDFNKIQRQQNRKMKKIMKYSVVHKFPCVDCAR